MQEGVLLTQLFYFPMLFLSGVTIPITVMPAWLQTVAQFIPMTYFTSGLQPILRGTETLFDNLPSVGALALTAVARHVPRGQAVPLGEGREAAPGGEVLAAGRAGSVFLAGRLADARQDQYRQGESAGPRSPAKPQRPDPRCAPVSWRRHRDRSRVGSDQGRQDRRNLHRSGARRQVAARRRRSKPPARRCCLD